MSWTADPPRGLGHARPCCSSSPCSSALAFARTVPFPTPEDTAYYVMVARNLVEGHGLTSDALWSFQTPPLAFPAAGVRGLAAAADPARSPCPWSLLGTTFAVAQVPALVIGALIPVLAWRLGGRRGGRARAAGRTGPDPGHRGRPDRGRRAAPRPVQRPARFDRDLFTVLVLRRLPRDHRDCWRDPRGARARRSSTPRPGRPDRAGRPDPQRGRSGWR